MPVSPLDGLRVVDLSRILAGPFATMMLGDLGAEVVKIELPGRGDDTRYWGPPFEGGVATYFIAVNRNKRSVTLDLKSEAGRQVLWRLLERADVLVSNFRPGVMERLGFGYDAVAERCPRVIHAVINGYGESGPAAKRSSFDLVIQAESGLMDVTGQPDGVPTKVGVSIADQVAGLYLVQGVQAALLARYRTGRGQRVEIALHDAMVSMLTYQAQQYLTAGISPRRLGNAHPSLAPYQPFKTLDGSVIVGVTSELFWHRFCEAAGLVELLDQERFASNAGRVEHRGELEAAIGARFAGENTRHWIEVLGAAGVACAAIGTVAEALDGDITAEREMVVKCPNSDLRLLGVPVKLSETPGRVRSAPPGLGEHTDEVLAELGYTPQQVAALRRARVI